MTGISSFLAGLMGNPDIRASDSPRPYTKRQRIKAKRRRQTQKASRRRNRRRR